MNFNNLDAVIYAEGLSEGESGQAKLSPFDRTCEFSGEFVPMLKIDAPVMIICNFNGTPLLRVCGKAYLSTRNYLRVTDVECSLCDGAENLIETTVSIEAEIVKRGLRYEKLTTCTVSAIGTEYITISECDINPEGSEKRIILRLGYPVFPKDVDLLLCASEKGLKFGDQPRVAYRYEKISPRNMGYIKSYIRGRENAKLADLFKKR